MQHMFPFKACHCLPAFLLASAFPRELSMSLVGSAQCWPLCWKIRNMVCYLNFSSPSKCQVGASCRICLSHEAWLWWSLMEKGTDGRSLSPNLTCNLTCMSFSWLCWVAQGRASWGNPIPKAQMGQSQSFSPFFNPGKLPRHSKVPLLPKTSGLCCAKLLSPTSWSPLTSRSPADLSEMMGSRPCSFGGKPSDGDTFRLCSETGLGWRELWAQWWGMWKKLSNRRVTTVSQESASESEWC